jgi:predicted alternative tryptophan synthase beta-subunit
VIEDIKERIELNNKNRDRNVAVVGAGSAVAALLFSLL